ncbi:endoribonuclease MazF [soil metagenome]
MDSYYPQRGDIIWIDLHPQIGREQAKRRPFIVLSPSEYNRKVGLVIGCPITSKIKAYPFEVLLPKTGLATGAILADQIKSLDWQKRTAKFIERAPEDLIVKTVACITVLLQVTSVG